MSDSEHLGDGKDIQRDVVRRVRRRLDGLPESSPLRQYFNDAILEETMRWIKQSDPADLKHGPWPMPVSVLSDMPDDEFRQLDCDLAVVLPRIKESKRSDLMQFLCQTASNWPAEWHGRRFDVWSRARVLDAKCEVEFDAPLPNRRDSDMRVRINGRFLRFENTAIAESDQERAEFMRFLEAKKQDRDKIWVHRAEFDSPENEERGPYYDCFRLYLKVYDKITKDLDPDKGQCAEDEPNILLISFCGAIIRPNDPCWKWALSELFDPQPSRGSRSAPCPGVTDISLGMWVEHHAAHILSEGKLSREKYEARMKDYDRIVSAPRRLGGILLFTERKLTTARINYNADEKCSITHAEMAELERIFCAP